MKPSRASFACRIPGIEPSVCHAIIFVFGIAKAIIRFKIQVVGKPFPAIHFDRSIFLLVTGIRHFGFLHFRSFCFGRFRRLCRFRSAEQKKKHTEKELEGFHEITPLQS